MIETLLQQLARHLRKARTGDGQGGRTFEFTEIGVGIKCRVSVARSRDVQIGGQRQAIVTHTIYFDRGFQCRVGDRFEIDGVTYEVRVPSKVPPSYNYVAALVEEYQVG